MSIASSWNPEADRAACEQLELFQLSVTGVAASPLGIPRHVARASISPGWWRLVAPLYSGTSEPVSVDVCAEQEGCLLLEASITDGDGTTVLDLADVRASAGQTCGCCSLVGRPYRARLEGPTRVVCDKCRARLQGGESYLSIADDFFHLDGSPRLLPWRPAIARHAAHFPASSPARRPCTTLPADELRQLINDMRVAMSAEVIGQPDVVARLALIAATHVGGGLSRGGRALILGPTGCGKSTAIRAIAKILEPWDAPFVSVNALDLTASGWSGAPSIGDLVEASLKGASVDSDRARHCVVVIDELHHAREIRGTEGNMRAKRDECLHSLLGLADGSVHFEGGQEWSSRQALVIGVGAFSGLLDLSKGQPSVSEIVSAGGIPIELTTRLAQEVLVLRHLPEADLVQLLKRWPALTSLQGMCERLGYGVRILDETYRHAARIVTLTPGSSSPRTGGGWLVSALRLELTKALQEPGTRELVIAPDSLPIPSTAMRVDPLGDGWDDPEGWHGKDNSRPRI